MKELRSSRRLIQLWHKREKATIDHLISAIGTGNSPAHTTHSAFTASGLPVEEQVRKAWRPCGVGLATF